MSLVTMTSGIFATLEKTTDLPQVDLDHADALNTMIEGEAIGDVSVLQLSSTLIRVSQVVREWVWTGFSWTSVDSTFEMRVSGSGIGPVGTLTQLTNAINNGIATGALNTVRILQNGTEVLSLSIGASGYLLSSGAQSVRVDGDLPLNFTELFDLADLFVDLTNIFDLTTFQRNALFTKLDAFSLGGFAVLDGGAELFGIHITATTASLKLNGLVFAVNGAFPDRLGEGARLLWELADQFDTNGAIDPAALTGFDVTGLTIKTADGRVLATMPTPLDGTDAVWKVDGRLYSEMLMGGSGIDTLYGQPGAVRSVLAGMAGSDRLFGGSANDLLLGGSGSDRLDGGNGTDRLAGGAGNDFLTGGAQGDAFVFNPGGGIDRVRDFTPGVDLIQISAANALGDLTFTDIGTAVQIDFASIHIIVENIEIAQLRLATNFWF